METTTALAGLTIMIFAVCAAVKWALRAGAENIVKSQPLTPQDLIILEDTASRLMDDLRQVTDECVARIELACCEASIASALLPKPYPITDGYERPRMIDVLVADEANVVSMGIENTLSGELELMTGLQKISSARR